MDGCFFGEVTHGRVVADEVDEVIDCDACVIDGDDLDVGPEEGCAEDITAWE